MKQLSVIHDDVTPVKNNSVKKPAADGNDQLVEFMNSKWAMLDPQNGGYATYQDICNLLIDSLGMDEHEDMQEFVARYDADQDVYISYEEYATLLQEAFKVGADLKNKSDEAAKSKTKAKAKLVKPKPA